MKTIQIPKYSNPFTVVINNSVYRYKAGETVEVPDEVAAAIEDALKLEPKPKVYLSKIAQFANGSITELTLNDLDDIETIAYYAFRNCTSLKSVEIPSSVKSVCESAFFGCNRIESVRFEDNSELEKIEAYAFTWCALLTSVYLPDVPPILADVNAFQSIATDCKFYCKSQASLEAYKVAENWSTLASTYEFVVEE